MPNEYYKEEYTRSNKNIKEFLIYWNNMFPLDYWYRKKFNIRFNSEEHKKSNFIDIKIEFEEEILFDKVRKSKEEWKVKGLEYNSGKYLRSNKVEVKLEDFTEEQIEDWYNSIDIDKL